MEDDSQSSGSLDDNDSGNNMAAGEMLSDPLSYPCPHCTQSFRKKVCLKKHIQCRHPEVIQKLQKCQTNLKAYEYPSELKQHAQEAHSDEKRHNCPKCEYKSKFVGDLRKHLKIHDKNRERFLCSICGKKYADGDAFSIHLETKHCTLNNEGNTNRENSQNNKGLGADHTWNRTTDGSQRTPPSEVTANLEAAETIRDPLPHRCPHCNKSFWKKVVLKKHVQCFHPEFAEKPHQCHVCPKAFEYPSFLKQHVLEAHSVEKPRKCSKCEYQCKSERSLKSHLKVHEQEPVKFKCSICEKEFVRKSDRSRHVKKTHVRRNNEGNAERDNSEDSRNGEKELGAEHVWNRTDDSNQSTRALEDDATKSNTAPGETITDHGSLDNEAYPESDLSQDHSQTHFKEEMNQAEASASGEIVEAAAESVSLAVCQSDQDGLGTVDNPSTGPGPVSYTTENAVMPAWWVCYCGSIYSSNEDLKRHCEENHKPDCTIENPATVFGNVPGEFSQEVSLSCLSNQNDIFAWSNPTTGPSNAQREASGGTAEASPENSSLAVSHGAQNDIFTEDSYPSAGSGCIESQMTEREFPLGVWDCHCGNWFTSQQDLQRHCDEDHKLDCSLV